MLERLGHRLNLSRIESFYLHRFDRVALIPVFVAVVELEGLVRLSEEHEAHEWLPVAAGRSRLAWPRERRALEDVEILLGSGTAGPLEDVLRIADL